MQDPAPGDDVQIVGHGHHMNPSTTLVDIVFGMIVLFVSIVCCVQFVPFLMAGFLSLNQKAYPTCDNDYWNLYLIKNHQCLCTTYHYVNSFEIIQSFQDDLKKFDDWFIWILIQFDRCLGFVDKIFSWPYSCHC